MYYSIPYILGALSVITIGILVLSKDNKSKINILFFVFCFHVFAWLLSYAVAFLTTNPKVAFVSCRIACTAVLFTTPTAYYFAALYLNVFQKEKKYIYSSYAIFFLMLPFFIFTNIFLGDYLKYEWGYYSKAGKFHPLYLIIWISVWIKSLTLFSDSSLWEKYSTVEKNRVRYIFVMFLISGLGGVDYIQKYGIDIYPFGWVFELIFAIVVAYAIVKHRLLDIKVAFTRTGIFIGVYSIVLGMPFAIAFGCQKYLISIFSGNWWMIPLIVSTILATLGPYIYLYFQRKAEQRMFQEQHLYQDTLRKASLGMGRIKDLNRLLNLIVHIVSKTIKVDNCEIYLPNETTEQLVLRASKGSKSIKERIDVFSVNNVLINYMKNFREPILKEEIKFNIEKNDEHNAAEIEAFMEELNSELVLPSFIDQRLVALIVLGPKKSGKIYSQDDLAVFSILTNQAGLAIENAIYYEEMKQKHEQLFRAEKMATIGTMADGLSHQINNRLHSMGFIASDALDTLKQVLADEKDENVSETCAEIQYALEKVQKNVKQGGEVVEGLLKYTRKGAEGISLIDINELLDATLDMIQYKVNLKEIRLTRNISPDFPKVTGNFTQLQEVFFNIIDNAYDAMVAMKQETEDKNYKYTLEISAFVRPDEVVIQIKDNGIGVKEENQKKMFTPFFTTKTSSKKGTGLGLYVIRQIIEENHQGNVEFTSQYHKGTQLRICLPRAEELVA